MRSHTVMDSPVGRLTLVATDGVLSGLYMEQQRYRPAQEVFGEPDPAPFTHVVRQMEEYFAGDRTTFDVPIAFEGTEFQRTVWQALCDIPYGETISYGELALRLGRTMTASRAVGLANGKNPISIIVPCHRVVGSTGDLTGYGGGIARKRFLLDFERGGTLAYSWSGAEPKATLNRSHQMTTLRTPSSEVPAGIA
ncbi:Methylated-DNA--protein-cysteine methyltransferase [Kibdelosporangium persicum]|uniref:Methylated-DNA--protein-cysteine methyltransferase n=1 Tax=Kibdelosporangium persicum TaxID=2698649 RepID=A0ABX2F6G5_9PSEU|nr:Methylated-DNA--protein-cysteine methyltransferase [Kibdelosporangium persicum]